MSRSLDRALHTMRYLKNWQAALIIVVIGFAVFSTGLHNPFLGDDSGQIVDNLPVHSIMHIKLFFEGGTFYDGQGLRPLIGNYYRPLMTTTFSLIYTFFGPHPFYFHLFQLLLCIGSAILLYLFFRYSFKPLLSLTLAVVFLVHPLDSQVVYSIPCMQDALYIFFGLLGLWLLIRFESKKSLLLVVLCFFLALLAKETALVFVVLALLYLFWWDRRRLYWFMGLMALPVVLWLGLKLHAVGLNRNPVNSPIDDLGLGGRLLTVPSIVLFYVVKFIFPWRLASAYYWTRPHFTFAHVLLPLLVDCAIAALVVLGAWRIRRHAPKAQYVTYLFFGAWVILGLLPHLQLSPLDFTASEPWFYPVMPGVLGLIGLAVTNLKLPVLHPNRRVVWPVVGVLVLLLGIRSMERGYDYQSSFVLAQRDIVATKEQFNAYTSLANYYFLKQDVNQAKGYAEQSVAIYSGATNNNTLGACLLVLGDYDGAYNAFQNGLKRINLYNIYENLAELTLVHGTPQANQQFFVKGINLFPEDVDLWYFFAIHLYRNGYHADAKVAIERAASYGQVPRNVYEGIEHQQPFMVNLAPGKNVTIN